MKRTRIVDLMKENGQLAAIPTGSSMWPMLRSKHDSVVLEAPQGRLKRRQIAMYRRPSGECVLHRVVAVHDREYEMCGDNQWVREDRVTDQEILGVVCGFYRGDHYVTCANHFYRFYTWIWCSIWPVRRLILQFFSLIRRQGHQLLGEVQHLTKPGLPFSKHNKPHT